ncbi:MAG TPA: class II glutamine amidotransferase [Acidimicrobiia bacterium]|jgi:glutamine amidotransferase
MCRHLAYVGPPVPLAALLTQPPHSLVAQARRPKEQVSGNDNPDGWGVGWVDDDGRAHRHRSSTPIWVDPALDDLAESVVTSDVLGAARLASPGSKVEESGNAPFVADGRWFFSLNGCVEGYHHGVGDELRALVTERRRACIEGESDSEVLFALALDRLDAGRTAADALADVVCTIEERTTGRLNLLLTECGAIAATAVGNSLHHCGAALVASEPLDEAPGWERIPDRSVVTSDGADLVVTAL